MVVQIAHSFTNIPTLKRNNNRIGKSIIKSCQIHSLKIQVVVRKAKIEKPKHIQGISRHSGVMMPKDGDKQYEIHSV